MRYGWEEQGEESWGLREEVPKWIWPIALFSETNHSTFPENPLLWLVLGVNPAVFRGYSKFSIFFVCLFVPPPQY